MNRASDTGQATAALEARASVLAAAHARHPERFVRGRLRRQRKSGSTHPKIGQQSAHLNYPATLNSFRSCLKVIDTFRTVERPQASIPIPRAEIARSRGGKKDKGDRNYEAHRHTTLLFPLRSIRSCEDTLRHRPSVTARRSGLVSSYSAVDRVPSPCSVHRDLRETQIPTKLRERGRQASTA